MPPNTTTYSSEPEYNQLAVRMAIQAQNTSLGNGGLSGLYWKYNADPNFRAEAKDVAGNWAYNDVHQDVTYPANDTTIADDKGGIDSSLQSITQDLTAKGLQYPNASDDVGTCVDIWGSAFIWSASPQPSGFGPWDVKASVDTDMNYQCVRNRTLTLKCHHCSLHHLYNGSSTTPAPYRRYSSGPCLSTGHLWTAPPPPRTRRSLRYSTC
jgi:hypothetical protein